MKILLTWTVFIVLIGFSVSLPLLILLSDPIVERVFLYTHSSDRTNLQAALTTARAISNSTLLTECPNIINQYSKAEVQHLIDVQSLFVLLFRSVWILVGMASLVGVSLVLRPGRMEIFSQATLLTGCFLLIVLCALAVAVTLAWEKSFLGFHLILFPQGNFEFSWDDRLIQLFPPQFWMAMAWLWIGLVVTIATLLTTLGFLLQKRRQSF